MLMTFMIYGSYGFLGDIITRLALNSGLRPILAGRDGTKLAQQATGLSLEYRVFGLDNPDIIDQAFKNIEVVLNCAGPYIYTHKPMVEACLRNKAHYLDLTGEIPVYESLAAMDEKAKSRGIMLLPGVGFDVVPTDCLAMHLKRRLPSATRLTLAFQSIGPAGMPPGTQRTMIELIPFGDRVRRDGSLIIPERKVVTRTIDLGHGLVKATRITWGDVFTAFYSTNIPNIEDYIVLSDDLRRQMTIIRYLRPIFKSKRARDHLKRDVKKGPTSDLRNQTITHVWGEVVDDQQRKAVSLLHGPEAGATWTSQTALAAVQKVLAGNAPAGFQTPALAYGADFVLECKDVEREDLI